MWWRDRPALSRATSRIFSALVLVGALAGCTSVRPLYGSVESGTSTTQERLSHVDVAVADTRVGQRVRNKIVFGLTGGSEAGSSIYRLDIRVTDSSLPLGVQQNVAVPSAYLVQLSANYVLVDIASGRTLTTGNSFANASYDFSQQRFANVRAQRDAEDRAADTIAADIRTKLAVFFAAKT